MPDSSPPTRARRTTLVFVLSLGLTLAPAAPAPAQQRATIEELRMRDFLDDYESNVVYGYDIVMETERFAARYAGKQLRCTNCHLEGGTRPDGFPLNIAGLHPQ